MAEPKRKISKQRKHTRSANWKLSMPNLVECPKCHAKILSHTVCKACGYYDGREIIVKKEKKK